MTHVIETENADQVLRQASRDHRGRPRGRGGRGVRLPRPERRRQDDDDPDAARPPPADLRQGARSSASTRPRPGRDPSAARLPAGRVRAVRQADRRPDARLLRQPARRRRSRLPGAARSSASRSIPTRKFREYSKGNKQKIGLVIALQHRPELLLLDEPTSGLDPLIQQKFYASSARPRTRAGRSSSQPHPVRGREDVRPRRRSSAAASWPGSGASRPCATSPTTRSSSSSPARSRRPLRGAARRQRRRR